MKDLVFHIGHHKTATSWLQDYYFSMHPDINAIATDYRAPWDDGFLNYLVLTPEKKFSVDHCRKTVKKRISATKTTGKKIHAVSAERLSGDPYSGGYDRFLLATRLHVCFPHAKIILTIRNQVSMIRSVYIQQIREGYCGKFTDFIYGKRWSGTAFSLDMFEYDLLISHYLDLFPKRNLLFLVYEDFVNHPSEFLDSISEFLAINPFVSDKIDQKTNKSRNESKIRRTRLLNHFKKSEHMPFPIIRLNHGAIKLLYKSMSPIFRLSKKSLIPEQDIAYVKNYYQRSNKRLREILGKDLPDYP